MTQHFTDFTGLIRACSGLTWMGLIALLPPLCHVVCNSPQVWGLIPSQDLCFLPKCQHMYPPKLVGCLHYHFLPSNTSQLRSSQKGEGGGCVTDSRASWSMLCVILVKKKVHFFKDNTWVGQSMIFKSSFHSTPNRFTQSPIRGREMYVRNAVSMPINATRYRQLVNEHWIARQNSSTTAWQFNFINKLKLACLFLLFLFQCSLFIPFTP